MHWVVPLCYSCLSLGKVIHIFHGRTPSGTTWVVKTKTKKNLRGDSNRSGNSWSSLSLATSAIAPNSTTGRTNAAEMITIQVTLQHHYHNVDHNVTKIAHLFLYTYFLYWGISTNYLRILSHLSLKCEGRWGTTDDFTTSFLHFSLFSTALWDLPNSRRVHSLMLSCHLFLCLPCLLPHFKAPCKMVLARPDEQETWPYHCSLRLFTMVRRSSYGPIACWILARTSSLVKWSLYEIRSILW